MKKLQYLKKSLMVLIFMAIASLVFIQSYSLEASTISEPYINDNFDKGLDDTKWQIVNDDEESIDFAKQGGALRYDVTAGGEQALVTTNQLTQGEGVTGYQVQFDLHYKSDDWGAWYAFAFNKQSVVNGLDWGAGGYLMGRTSSLQPNNPADSSSTGEAVDAFEALTPEIPAISFTNITFKFVYTNSDKTVDVYYDVAGEDADLETKRVTYTFGSLSSEGSYHFAIIGSSAQFEVDNLVIDQLKGSEVLNHLTADFETNELPEEISLPKADEFSYGPAGTLRIEDAEEDALVLSKVPFTQEHSVYNPLKIKVDVLLEQLTATGKSGLIYGLSSLDAEITDEGVTILYFSNRAEGIYLTAAVADGEKFTPVLDKLITVDPASFFTLELSFTTYGITTVTIDGAEVAKFTGGKTIGHYGFKGSLENTIQFDNFFSSRNLTLDQSNSPDLENNFNTGYVSEEDYEIYNFIDTKPGSEIPLFNTTKNIHVADGKLIFDVVSESSAFYTKHSYTDFELRFEVSDFGKPVTPTNEDGEIEGIEIPETLYIAVGFGYESNKDNFWDVTTMILQDRFGAGVVYGMNVGDNNTYQVPEELRMGKEENEGETYQFKFIVLNGVIQMWVKRASDPSDIFDGAPLIEYRNTNTTGRIGISSSALGSFKMDNFSLTKIDNATQPEIGDIIDPVKVDGPAIEKVANKEVFLIAGSTAPDFKTYFTANDNQDGAITITDAMINTNGFDINKPGQYNIVLTVKDSDDNTTTSEIVVSVSNPEPIEEQPTPAETKTNVPLIIGLIVGSLAVGAAGFWVVTNVIIKKK